MFTKDQFQLLSDVLLAISWLAIIFAVYGFIAGESGVILNIASTQWLLISLILCTNAMYLKLNSKK